MGAPESLTLCQCLPVKTKVKTLVLGKTDSSLFNKHSICTTSDIIMTKVYMKIISLSASNGPSKLVWPGVSVTIPQFSTGGSESHVLRLKDICLCLTNEIS